MIATVSGEAMQIDLNDEMPGRRVITIGILSILGAGFMFSLTDVSIKFLSGGYALHQVILIRSLIGMFVLLAIIMPLQGGYSALRTRRLGMHVLRGLCVVFANMTFFLGLAALPLTDAVAISFVAPLLITVFSVFFLGETVGPRRWLAVGVGLAGVVVMMRPGGDAFRMAAFLPLASAAGYAGLQTLTRKIGGTERPSTMTFYIQLSFLVVSAAMGLAAGDGRFAGSDDASLEFLLRPWIWPRLEDLPILVLIGVTSALGGYLISQAYSLCEAALIAPFEYIAVPLAIVWSVTIFGEWPDTTAWAGITLIIGAGLYMLWRETSLNKRAAPPRPRSIR